MPEDLVLDTMAEEKRKWMNITLNATLFSRRITSVVLGKLKHFFCKLTKLKSTLLFFSFLIINERYVVSWA